MDDKIDEHPRLTPEQCLVADIQAAVETAQEADIPFDTIRDVIMNTLAEMDPSQFEEPPDMSGTEPNPYTEIYSLD